MPRRYSLYDVFTDVAFAGNPLAVVHDAEGLDTSGMQRIAREFNLSETTFLLPVPEEPTDTRVRIFTPARELPFAGHPTVGSAVALAHDGVSRSAGGNRQSLTLLEEVGAVAVDVTVVDSRVGFARFKLPQIAADFPWDPDPKAVASVLGIEASDIGFDNHRLRAFDAGLPYFMVPVRDLSVMARLRPDFGAWYDVFRGGANHDSAFVYCRETVEPGSHFHARMYWPVDAIREDPATGSAVASFVGVLQAFEDLPDGTAAFVIEQGVEMGRPSYITLEVAVSGGTVVEGHIGGHAVRVAQGTLES